MGRAIKTYLRILCAGVFGVTILLCAVAAAEAEENPHALIFVIDGIPNELFAQMLEQGDLPNLQEHIYDRGVHSKHHTTVFPPLTFPAMVSIFSGRYLSGHRVPNFFWVSRDEARYKNYVNVLFTEFQADVEENVDLLFQYFPAERTLAFGLPLNIGGDYTRHLTSSFIDPFREFRDLDYIHKTISQEHAIAPDMFVKPLKLLSLVNPAKETNIISLLNPFSPSGVVRYSLASFSERERQLRRQVPTAVLYYEWATDHFGHEDGPMSDDVRESLIEADMQFGRLVRVYREAGIYDRTYFFLLSDHGQLSVRPRYVPIDRIFRERGFKTRFVSHELVAKTGLSGVLRIKDLLPGSGTVEGYNCALGTAGGGSVAAFFSKNGGTDADSWKEEVYLDDLLSYQLGNDDRIDVVDFVKSIDGVHFFFVRESEFVPGKPHATRIIGPNGSSRVSARFDGERLGAVRYEIVEGDDPLEYTDSSALAAFIAEGYHNDRDWLRATADTKHPDAPVQIAQIMETPRAGSAIIIPNDDSSYNSRVWSKHGGLSAGEILTTFAMSGPGIKHGTIEYSRTVDFAPTFLHLMGKDVTSRYFDGIVLDEALDQ